MHYGVFSVGGLTTHTPRAGCPSDRGVVELGQPMRVFVLALEKLESWKA